MILFCLAGAGCDHSDGGKYAGDYILSDRPSEGVSIVYEVAFPQQSDPARALEKAVGELKDSAYTSGLKWYVTSPGWNEIEIVVPVSSTDTAAQDDVITRVRSVVETGSLAFRLLAGSESIPPDEYEITLLRERLAATGQTKHDMVTDWAWYPVDRPREQWNLPEDQARDMSPDEIASYLSSSGRVVANKGDRIYMLAGDSSDTSTVSGKDDWHVDSVKITMDDFGQRAVAVHLDDNGAQAIKRITSAHVGRFMALVVNDRIVMAPMIHAAIPGGELLITGRFSESELHELAGTFVEKKRSVIIDGPPAGITVFGPANQAGELDGHGATTNP